jgi:preprotein translocase subunit SecA
MCHLELSIDAEELAAMEQSEQEMQESRMDPAFVDGEMQGTGTDGMHPAAAMQVQNQPATAASASIDPDDPPPGWEMNQALGRWLNPNDPDTWGKVPRNASCPCGSGKKYKQCHGRV